MQFGWGKWTGNAPSTAGHSKWGGIVGKGGVSEVGVGESVGAIGGEVVVGGKVGNGVSVGDSVGVTDGVGKSVDVPGSSGVVVVVVAIGIILLVQSFSKQSKFTAILLLVSSITQLAFHEKSQTKLNRLKCKSRGQFLRSHMPNWHWKNALQSNGSGAYSPSLHSVPVTQFWFKISSWTTEIIARRVNNIFLNLTISI